MLHEGTGQSLKTMRRESDILALLVVASSKATKALWFDLSNKSPESVNSMCRSLLQSSYLAMAPPFKLSSSC